MGKTQIKNTHTSFSESVRNTVRKLCKYLIFSVYGGERGILYRFYTRRNTLIISALFFQKNAILPIFVANLSQDKAL